MPSFATVSGPPPRASPSEASAGRCRRDLQPQRAGLRGGILGVAQAGATNTTVNGLYGVDELTFQLRDCEARMLITHPALADRALAAARAVGITDVVSFGEMDGALPFETLLADGDNGRDDPPGDRHGLAAVLIRHHTGLPKGVRLTHTNWSPTSASSRASSR